MGRRNPLAPPSPSAIKTGLETGLNRQLDAVQTIEAGLNAVYRIEGSDLESGPAIFKLATYATDDDLRAEFETLRALATASAAPVPTPLTETAASETGLPAYGYLMRAVPGRVVRRIADFGPRTMHRLVDAVGRALGAIHRSREFDRFGEPVSHAGQLTVTEGPQEGGQWVAQQATNVADALRGEGFTTEVNPTFVDLAPTVEATLRDQADRIVDPPARLCHGDPRPGNMILAQADDDWPLLRALIDVGGSVADPLSDLANAEVALIGVPFGETQLANPLRERLRTAYTEAT
ncbi:MAG: phosphotransferase family protein, partial [Halobacteriaceae archaeon]